MELVKELFKSDVTVSSAVFSCRQGVREVQSVFEITSALDLFEDQLSVLISAVDDWRNRNPDFSPAFLRFFLSDAANQESILKSIIKEKEYDCACSIVQQPPLNGSKIALWCYWQTNIVSYRENDFYIVEHGSYRHCWYAGTTLKGTNPYQQTTALFEKYEADLKNVHFTFQDDCIRTWLYVQNIDANYQGVVEARRDNFEKIGLTSKTHYVASTGIEGRTANAEGLVKMDAYAVAGLKPKQQQFLYAKGYLNPTYEYGVTFERGVKVCYGDRNHLFISGTASIDNKGNVLYEGDVCKQTLRMWENVEQLLKEGDATMNDVMQMLVYLRDLSDYSAVKKMFDDRFPSVPKLFLLAPVCRPKWLIEMECIAISSVINKDYPSL